MTRTTYFRILVQERRWTTYEAFHIQFQRAGQELARRDGDNRLATVPLSERQFMRWMTGDIKGLPRSYTCRILERLFGLSVDQLFADPPTEIGTRPADAPPATAGGSGQTLVAWDRPDDVIQQTRALLTTNTDPALLQMAEESIASVVARYELLGPKQLVGETHLLRRMLHTLLAGHQLTDQRRWLLSLAARTAGLLGYMAVNASRPEAAEAYCTEALALADQIQDTGLQMWVLGTRSLSLYYLGRYAESDAAAAAGVALAPTDPQAIRLLANGRARALARLGDQRQTRRAVGQALELSDRQQQLSTGITPCISFVPYSPARTLANAVTAYLSAGDVPQVLAYANEIDELVERSESQWTRALVGLDVATALLRQGSPDLEQAMALGREALRAGGAMPIRSVWQRAHELLEQAGRWRDERLVRDYAEELRALAFLPNSEVLSGDLPST